MRLLNCNCENYNLSWDVKILKVKLKAVADTRMNCRDVVCDLSFSKSNIVKVKSGITGVPEFYLKV